jgi:hypothetical protein
VLNVPEQFVADAVLVAKLNSRSSFDPQEFTRQINKMLVEVRVYTIIAITVST